MLHCKNSVYFVYLGLFPHVLLFDNEKCLKQKL